VFQH
jgi:hypothetical protein